MTGTPKVVWMLWLQGWNHATPLVAACRRSWERLNPGWEVRALTSEDVAGLVPIDLAERLRPAHVADIARLELLAEHGGVWADATTYCRRPLDDWLPDSEFFAFDSPAPDRLLSNWFLAASPGSYIAKRWAEASRDYWHARAEPDDYYWPHYLFSDLCRTDPAFAASWESVPKVSARGPHYFAPYGRRFTGPMGRRAHARLAAQTDPLFKLHRPDRTAPGSAARWFVNGAAEPLRPSPALMALDQPIEAARWAYRDALESGRKVARDLLRDLSSRPRPRQ